MKRHKGNPPFTHDLTRLVMSTELALTDEYIDLLDVITTFNIQARYDDYKQEFKTKCNEEYTQYYFLKVKEFLAWIDKQQ